MELKAFSNNNEIENNNSNPSTHATCNYNGICCLGKTVSPSFGGYWLCLGGVYEGLMGLKFLK